MKDPFLIVIPFASKWNTLRVMQSLGALGARFILLSNKARLPAQGSRYCKTFIHVATPGEPAMLESLLELAPSCPGAVLLPTMEEGGLFIARHRDRLAGPFLLPPLAGETALLTAMDKLKLQACAQQLKLPVLETLSISENTGREGVERPDDGSFPLLLKPRNGQGGQGIIELQDAEALQQHIQTLAPEQRSDYFLQPKLTGRDVSLSAFCQRGEIKAYTLWEALHYPNKPFTVPTCLRFIEQEAVYAFGARLLAHLEWEGICDLDFFIEQGSGHIWLLEMNPRFWANIPACTAAGVNFPLLMVQAARAPDTAPASWPLQQAGFVYSYPSGLPASLAVPGGWSGLLQHPFSRLGGTAWLSDPLPLILSRARKAKAGVRNVLKRRQWNRTVAWLFLLLQLLGIAWARVIPERFFCWAPYDEHTRFSIAVEIEGRQLSKQEIRRRYHYPAAAWEPRSIHNVRSIIQQYESTYGRNDQARVHLRYAMNGHPEQLWEWNP